MMSNIPSHVIAIVDDDLRVLEAVGNLLESSGYTVLRFVSADALMSYEDVSRVDFLISDIGLPGTSGLELQRWLGQLFPALPVILITARKELIRAGASAHNNRGVFEKPFDGDQLLKAISDALDCP